MVAPHCHLRHHVFTMITIYVDADARPVKDEVYVVATRYGVPVMLVANASMHVPDVSDHLLRAVSLAHDGLLLGWEYLFALEPTVSRLL